MKKMMSVLAAVLCLTAVLFAQENKSRFAVFGGTPDDRACVRIEYFDTQKKMLHQAAIDYGTPPWKKEYDDAAGFDKMTKGKIWRMGSNFWSRLETQMPLRISGKNVPAGLWYLGIRRSQDGAKWSLVLIDPAKARAAGVLDSFMIENAPVEIEAPMVSERSPGVTEKLTVTMKPRKESQKNVDLRVMWGRLQLTATVEVILEGLN